MTRDAFVLLALAATQVPARAPAVAVPGVGTKLEAGWRLVVRDGCAVALPPGWTVAEATAPSAAAGNTVAIASVPITSWAAHKAAVRRTFAAVDAVHEDSERRLWMEIDLRARREDYVAIPDHGRACAVTLVVEGAARDEADTIKRVVESVALQSGREGW